MEEGAGMIEDRGGEDEISGLSSAVTSRCASEGVGDGVGEAEGSNVDEGIENVGARSG